MNQGNPWIRTRFYVPLAPYSGLNAAVTGLSGFGRLLSAGPVLHEYSPVDGPNWIPLAAEN